MNRIVNDRRFDDWLQSFLKPTIAEDLRRYQIDDYQNLVVSKEFDYLKGQCLIVACITPTKGLQNPVIAQRLVNEITARLEPEYFQSLSRDIVVALSKSWSDNV